ncbi:MAG: hypothetical protein FJY75_09145 [Candidatus Eisenbacteria bacterium]|uniref:Uncharacterized protein n=1 Tax=Eiseniibacteriota bacterium TaxID=2212470 RepID=A0A938BP62_UNCEI|nr:hypothetical protein [Candidatus Eisenbacteria bacterium]
MAAESDLIAHLRAVTGLDEPLARKILEEVLAWHREDLGAWARRRHEELRRQGLRNREIFPRLREEARRILVRPPEQSERQLRRILYG